MRATYVVNIKYLPQQKQTETINNSTTEKVLPGTKATFRSTLFISHSSPGTNGWVGND